MADAELVSDQLVLVEAAIVSRNYVSVPAVNICGSVESLGSSSMGNCPKRISENKRKGNIAVLQFITR